MISFKVFRRELPIRGPWKVSKTRCLAFLAEKFLQCGFQCILLHLVTKVSYGRPYVECKSVLLGALFHMYLPMQFPIARFSSIAIPITPHKARIGVSIVP
jgi:hypothetical protein